MKVTGARTFLSACPLRCIRSLGGQECLRSVTGGPRKSVGPSRSCPRRMNPPGMHPGRHTTPANVPGKVRARQESRPAGRGWCSPLTLFSSGKRPGQVHHESWQHLALHRFARAVERARRVPPVRRPVVDLALLLGTQHQPAFLDAGGGVGADVDRGGFQDCTAGEELLDSSPAWRKLSRCRKENASSGCSSASARSAASAWTSSGCSREAWPLPRTSDGKCTRTFSARTACTRAPEGRPSVSSSRHERCDPAGSARHHPRYRPVG